MSYSLNNFLDYQPLQPFLAVLGSPIDHSFSPLIHQHALNSIDLNWDYYAINVSDEDRHLLSKLLNKKGFKGANVTIPLKEKVPELVNSVDEEVEQIGAANTIYWDAGQWKAANTDVTGFAYPLQQRKQLLAGKYAVVLGSGGAARAVCYALSNNLSVGKIFLITRNPDQIDSNTYPAADKLKVIAYDQLETAVEQSELVVNTTPVGMHPETDRSPIPDKSSHLLSGKICYDLIYNPEETKFLTQADEVGGDSISGLKMFIYQAARSFEIWTGEKFPVDEAEELIRQKLHG